MTGRRITGWGVVALAAATAVLAGIVVLAVDVGSAQGVSASSGVPATVRLAAATGTVSVTSDRPLPARFASFSPGSSERWRVTATVSSAADLSLQLARTGVLATRPDGLALAVAVCSTVWSDDGTCPTRSSTLVSSRPLDAPLFDQTLPIARVSSGSATHLLLTFSLPDTTTARSDRSLMGQTATVVVTVGATGGVRDGSGSNGGVRPGNGGGSSGSGGSGGAGTVSGAGAPGSDGAPGSSAHGFGSGLLAFTGSWVALPAGVGLGLVLGGSFLLVRRRRSRRAR